MVKDYIDPPPPEPPKPPCRRLQCSMCGYTAPEDEYHHPYCAMAIAVALVVLLPTLCILGYSLYKLITVFIVFL